MEKGLMFYCLAAAAFLIKNLALAGLMAGFGVVVLELKEAGKVEGFIYKVSLPLFLLGALPGAMAIAFLAGSWLQFSSLVDIYTLFQPLFIPALLWGLAAAISVTGAFYSVREGMQLIDKAKNKLTKRTSLERNRKTDVREIGKFLPSEIGRFDPTSYFLNPSEDRLFVGLDEEKKPVFLDYESWKISHCLLSGRTRSGKGVAAQILLSQAIAKGEYVVVLDPKGDAWMPHIFRDACLKAGVPYNFLDLRQSAPRQTNLFQGCDFETMENMFIGGFSITEKGDIADFHRLKDRKAARDAARRLSRKMMTPASLWSAMASDELNPIPEGFSSLLQEMAELPAVNAAGGGIDVAAGVKTGGCLYVVGDMINPRIIRMQRMILLRLLFLAKNRDQSQPQRTITVFADEFKVHISRPFMTSLGASAGWGLHTILAFQSLQDLADCPADLDKDSVRGAVMENCAIQLSYSIKDPETAEWLAASTGKILVDDESRHVNRGVALAETVENQRTLRQADRYFIDENMIKNLPAGCGVLATAGRLAQFCYTSPVPAIQTPAAITVAPAISSASDIPSKPVKSTAAAALDLDDDEFASIREELNGEG